MLESRSHRYDLVYVKISVSNQPKPEHEPEPKPEPERYSKFDCFRFRMKKIYVQSRIGAPE